MWVLPRSFSQRIRGTILQAARRLRQIPDPSLARLYPATVVAMPAEWRFASYRFLTDRFATALTIRPRRVRQ